MASGWRANKPDYAPGPWWYSKPPPFLENVCSIDWIEYSTPGWFWQALFVVLILPNRRRGLMLTLELLQNKGI